jgi:hypothetical protein
MGIFWTLFGLLNLFMLTSDPLMSAAPMIIGYIAGMNFGAAAVLPKEKK